MGLDLVARNMVVAKLSVMRNFDCVPPVTQFNVQISILSAFVNYSAHMYEFLPQSL